MAQVKNLEHFGHALRAPDAHSGRASAWCFALGYAHPTGHLAKGQRPATLDATQRQANGPAAHGYQMRPPGGNGFAALCMWRSSAMCCPAGRAFSCWLSSPTVRTSFSQFLHEPATAAAELSRHKAACTRPVASRRGLVSLFIPGLRSGCGRHITGETVDANGGG